MDGDPLRLRRGETISAKVLFASGSEHEDDFMNDKLFIQLVQLWFHINTMLPQLHLHHNRRKITRWHSVYLKKFFSGKTDYLHQKQSSFIALWLFPLTFCNRRYLKLTKYTPCTWMSQLIVMIPQCFLLKFSAFQKS